MLRRTASCLLFTLLAGAHLCPAVERVKIAVVQTHTGVNRGTHAADSTTPDPISTLCNGGSGIYARDLGFYCQGPVIPLDQPPGAPGYSLFVDISVVMPDSARLVFHCSTVLDPGCQAIPDYPAATAVVCSDFVHGGSAYKDCTVSGSSPTGIGVYRAALHGDRMTIFGANWERHYFKYGTWEYLDPPAADPKPVSQETKPALPPADPKPTPPQEGSPAPSQEPKPAPPQETKPALPPETQPASPQEPSPAAPQDAKPAKPEDANPATPQDAKPETAPEAKPPDSTTAPAAEHASAAAHSPATSADQSIDPTVITQAKAGDAAAEYRLGYDYYLGRGVALDYVQAAIWWKKAADQGFPQAQNNLGVLYNAGKGVPQSYTEAYFWENLAAARASGPLQTQFAKNRDESASRLWFMARLSVQRKAAKWAADHPVPPRSHEPPGAPKP